MLVRPVNFIIMPIFALVNTNIAFHADMISGLFTPLGMGIVLGLVVGKPIGISVVSWLAVKSGLSALPERATWAHILGVGMLAGIGFTMSIFIAVLSFSGNNALLSEAKFSILIASVSSGIIGSLMLTFVSRRKG